MEIPLEMLGPVSLFYQSVKQTVIELIMDCHNPDYETTLENVRQRISKAEEEAF